MARNNRVKESRRATRLPEPEHLERSIDAADLDQLIIGACSANEATRARSVRNLCPCRIGWDGFQQGMPIVASLRKDSSPDVRRQALHVFEDAYDLQRMQDRRAEERAPLIPDADSTRRERQRDRRIKREVNRAFRSRRGRP